jgi:hypothetical protein
MDSVTKRPVERTGFNSAEAGIDRRRHRRAPLTLSGRFMREDKQEFSCRLVDVSVGGAAIHSAADVQIGERIIANFDHLGSLEGHVARTFIGGFAIELHATPYKREKLAGQITWLMNRHELGDAAEARRHERIAIANSKQASLKLDEGVTIPVNVLDFSMSGASIATTARPPIGHLVQIGKLKGKVVRHHSEGIGIEFQSVQPQDSMPDGLDS